MRVGIPRGLLYYHYLPMWKAFFNSLGAEVIVSSPTTEETVNFGCSRVVGDICLPVKVYCGHAHALRDKCDYLFIPAVHSMRPKLYNCPKFIGLPDMVRAAAPDCPPILDPDIDFNKGKGYFYDTVYQLASHFTRDTWTIDRTINQARDAHRYYTALMQHQGLHCPQAINTLSPGCAEPTDNHDDNADITVGLVGHRYLLYDRHMNYRLQDRLRAMGIRLLSAETVGQGELQDAMCDLVEKPYWAYEDEVVGAGAYYLRSNVDGIISVVAFSCGPDSMMMEMLQRHAKHLGRPFLNLVLDEHSSEGGLITRLEAFTDMVRRVKAQPPRLFHLGRVQREEKEGIHALGLPNMGAILPSFRASAKILDINLLVPPVTKRTISLGTRHAPEQACLPFKAILGTFIECLEQGADTLFMVTSSNACRMGYYSKVHEEILRDLGYEFKFLRHKTQDKGITGVLRTVRRCTNHAPWRKVIEAYILGTGKFKALDDLEKKAAKVRPVELHKGETDHVYKEGIQAIDDAANVLALKRAEHTYHAALDRIPRDPSIVPLKVGIVGELYVVLEPYVNLNLLIELGKLGAEVTRVKTSYLSEWTSLRSYMGILNAEKAKLTRYAYPYLRRDVGGHALESLAEKVRLAREGYDGVVHVAPFTCMPESIAQNLMPLTEENIPVLTLLCDEQVSETGVKTRLEAFVDLLQHRRRAGSKFAVH